MKCLIHFSVLLITLNLFEFNEAQETTHFVNQDSKLKGFAQSQWFKDNIPFIEVPDQQIEDVYYYRWASHKRHLRYTTPGNR